MKTISSIIISLCLAIQISFAQSTNWISTNTTQTNMVFADLGFDFGMTARLGYGKKIKAFIPILLSSDISMPMGKDLLDDYKFRIGGQLQILNKSTFNVTLSSYAIIRRYETSLVRIFGFGSEFSIAAGVYKSNWHLATEIGFDKSALTHLKHSDSFADNYPDVSDAWFLNAGGQFYYGIQTSRSINDKLKLNLRLGATNAEADHDNALLPVYFQFGVSRHI